jgi:REP-associated tyrosine transposase
MPRANRYILPGHVYHLTHRCHDREFLLRFAVHRNAYRKKLWEAMREFKLSLLDYSITSNHAHLLAFAEEQSQISGFIKKADGEFGQEYNRLKQRSGAFWEGRFHSTMVDSGEYLFRCMMYIELNMVRCRVVAHPSQWPWCGYDEMMGLRQRWRLLDLGRLLSLLRTDDLASFRKHFTAALALAIEKDSIQREACWTESIAVGSERFVREIEARVKRQRTETRLEGETWTLREVADELYGSVARDNTDLLDAEFGAKNRTQALFGRPSSP